MPELHHVNVAHDNFLVERLARAPVVQNRLRIVRQLRLLEVIADFLFLDAIKHRRRNPDAEQLASPAQMRLEHLPDIHARRHAQRVQDNVHGSSIGQVRHVFLGDDLCHHAFVTVTTCHLVADRQFALGRDVDLHRFDDSRIHVFAGFHAPQFLVVRDLEIVEFLFESADDFVDFVPDRRGVDLPMRSYTVASFRSKRLRDLAICRDDDFTGLAVHHVERNLFHPGGCSKAASVNCSRNSSILPLCSSSTCLECFFASVVATRLAFSASFLADTFTSMTMP